MDYRRTRRKGGTCFFTVDLADRSSTLLVDRIDDLRRTVRVVKQRHPFDIVAWVVLPDHMHVVWTLPTNDGDCATRRIRIKAAFSRAMPKGERIRNARRRKGERGIWQRRFREHLVIDDDDLRRHLDQVHINPVMHGYIAHAEDWPYSSIHRDMRLGVVPKDWAAASEGDVRAGRAEAVGLRCAHPTVGC